MTFEEELQQFQDKLFSYPLIKEYFAYKKILLEDPSLKALLDEIHQHEKNMTQSMMDDEIYQKEKKLYLEKKKLYEENPYVMNFTSLQEEVQALLLEIRDVLEDL